MVSEFNVLIAKKNKIQRHLDSYLTLFRFVYLLASAPIGSVLLGDKRPFIVRCELKKNIRGGMRQVGYKAAAIYALDNNISRLAEDHRRVKN
jgi:threonine aldolase